jgi:hypothetical protein
LQSSRGLLEPDQKFAKLISAAFNDRLLLDTFFGRQIFKKNHPNKLRQTNRLSCAQTNGFQGKDVIALKSRTAELLIFWGGPGTDVMILHRNIFEKIGVFC